MIKKYIQFFLFACICFIIADIFVNAEERDNFILPSGAQFYDNSNGSLTDVTTDYIDNGGQKFYMSYAIVTPPNASGSAIGFNLNEPLLQGYTYTISISVGPIGCGATTLSSYNRIGVGGSLTNAKNNYQNGGNATILFNDYQAAGQGYKGISYAFTPNRNGTYIVIPYTTANYCNDVNYFYGYTINNLGKSNQVSQQDITNSINNQTSALNQTITSAENNIKSNANTNRDLITSNSDANRDLIIQNQNENTTSQIVSDGNNSRQEEVNNCSNAYMFNLKSGYTISSSNSLVSTTGAFYTDDYVSIHSGSTQLIIKNSPRLNGYYFLVYNSNKSLLDYWYTEDNRVITLPSGAAYFRLSSSSSNVMVYDGNKGCTNRISAIDDTLKDDSVDSSNATDTLSNLSNSTASNSVISDLLLLPVRLFQNIVNSINGSCSPFNLGTLYNTNLTLPCINIPNLIGSTLWSVIDILFCGTFVLVIRKKFVDIFENLSELKNGGNEVE